MFSQVRVKLILSRTATQPLGTLFAQQSLSGRRSATTASSHVQAHEEMAYSTGRAVVRVFRSALRMNGERVLLHVAIKQAVEQLAEAGRAIMLRMEQQGRSSAVPALEPIVGSAG